MRSKSLHQKKWLVVFFPKKTTSFSKLLPGYPGGINLLWTGKKGPPHFSSMSSAGVLAFSGIPNEATPPPPAAAAAFGAGRCPPPTKSTNSRHVGGFKVQVWKWPFDGSCVDGLEKVTPFQNDHFWNQFVKFQEPGVMILPTQTIHQGKALKITKDLYQV